MSRQVYKPTRPTVAEKIATWAAGIDTPKLPAATQSAGRRLLLDQVGLYVAARNADFVEALMATAISDGKTTAIGHKRPLNPYDASLINGSAAHGEDFDDTFEGGPIHSGSAVVPAAIALAEERGLDGHAIIKGIVIGMEISCRGSTVAPMAIHRAGFHPSGVLSALGAAAAGAAMLGLDGNKIANAMGIAGSFASGIIEYLSDGSWTKRFHTGWAAQSGIRAALLAETGFTGPLSVFEGPHGFFQAFAPNKEPNYGELLDDLGTRYVVDGIAFKPLACGTMIHPYIDCMLELRAEGITADQIKSVVAHVAEGTVHRLWEPLDKKQHVQNGYVAKFSSPYCMAVGLLDGKVGFAQFDEARAHAPDVTALAEKITYKIDPNNPYPNRYTGQITATLNDGRVIEKSRPNFRGGAFLPLSDEELTQKYRDNCRYGGWDEARTSAVEKAIATIAAGGKVDFTAARG